MQTEFNTILFTSNLSATSREAFCHAAMLATRLKAKIIMLHVIDIPVISYDNLLIKLFGEEKMTRILNRQRKEARDALIGKVSTREVASTALDEFCRENQIESDQCGIFDYEINIAEGPVVDTIIKTAADHHCNMIVMGASEGIISGATIGSTIKAVLNTSKIPTLVVSPPKA